MKVYVSDNLKYIKDELSKRGYSIDDNKSHEPYDAIICNIKNGGLSSINLQGNIRNEGTLIIDSGSKTIDEIENILNSRVYSSIF